MPSNSSGSAPSSRVYSSAPRLRQRYFPPRERTVAASTRAPATIPRTKKQRQSTLTQLDFATSFQKDYDTEGEDDEGEATEWEAPVAKKKRKMMRTSTPDERQKTLTQMQWVCPDSDEDEEETAAFLKGNEDATEALHDDDLDEMPPAITQSTLHLKSEAPAVKDEPQSPQLASPSQRGAEIPIFEDPSSPTSPGPKPSIVATPQHDARQEVPSSQSPAASVISRSATASISPHKHRQRSHLGEMTINELAHRDTQLQNTPSKRQKRTEPVMDSNAEDDTGDDEELFDDEAENQEPDFPLVHHKSTPGKCGSGDGSSRTPSLTKSMFEPSQITGSRARYNQSPSATPRRLSSRHLALTPDMQHYPHDLDLDEFSPSSLSRRGRIASSPAGLLQEMRDEQHIPHSAEQINSPRRTLFRRSSQATTVDITQPSPQGRAPPSSPFMSSMGPPPRGVSQFPESGHSLDGLESWSRVGNTGTINSSAPLRTVSQLLGPSQGGDEFYDAEDGLAAGLRTAE